MLIENIYNQISIIEREIAVLPEEALQIRRSRIRITTRFVLKNPLAIDHYELLFQYHFPPE